MEENTTNISVIIPTASDLYLEKCLESVLNSINKYGKTTEIILVNNRPQNQEIKKIAEKFKVQYVEEKNPGSYRARNGGARKAQGDILAFCDVDCVVTENWLNEMEKSLANNEAVIGKTEGINENKTAKLEQMFYEMLMKNALVDTRNFGIKKSTFNHLGGFNEKLAFGGDMEFGARLDNQNFKIGRNEKMIVKHHNPTRIMKIILKRITQNFDNYNITEFHDDAFIKKYFPHIYKYKIKENKRSLMRLKFIPCQMLLGMNYFTSPILIFILPTPLALAYYKKLNGLCMHFGFLANILKRG